MKRVLKGNAFSMTEVVVASVIFVLASSGIYATIAKTSFAVKGQESRVQAALCGKEIMNGRNRAVASSTWAGGALSIGTHAVTMALYPNCASGVTSASYTVTASGSARAISLTVSW